ncbi:hypothetical protein C5C16_08350, partial [Rathayibacter rathayi]
MTWSELVSTPVLAGRGAVGSSTWCGSQSGGRSATAIRWDADHRFALGAEAGGERLRREARGE